MTAVDPNRTSSDVAFENLRQELRRGAIVLAVLTRLRSEHYGYALRKALVEEGLEVDENTLDPLAFLVVERQRCVSAVGRGCCQQLDRVLGVASGLLNGCEAFDTGGTECSTAGSGTGCECIT